MVHPTSEESRKVASVCKNRAKLIYPDHLNTPRMIADSTGTTVWRWDQGDPIGLEGAWSELYVYRPRYFDSRAGQYVSEQPDRMDDARYALVQGSMIFRRPLVAAAIPAPQEFNTYAYGILDPGRNFDLTGLQSDSLTTPPKPGGPSASPGISDYERCLLKACAAGTVAGGIVGRVPGAIAGFVGGFLLGGYFCPGDPPDFKVPYPKPGKSPPSTPPKAN